MRFRAISIASLLLATFPGAALADEGKETRLVLFFLVYGLGFLLTILLLIIIAKRDGKGSSDNFPPKIPPIAKP